MADRRDRLARLRELTRDVQHPLIQAQVFGRPAARNHQRIAISGINPLKAGIQRKQMTGFFSIRLVALEVVDACLHALRAFP